MFITSMCMRVFVNITDVLTFETQEKDLQPNAISAVWFLLRKNIWKVQFLSNF
jgi:hypothetical protein